MQDKERTEVLNNKPEKADARIIVVTVLLAAAVFIVDMNLPLGHVVWVPYLVLVLFSLWVPHRRYTLVVAAACTALIILGFLFCPPGVSSGTAIFNRSLGVLVVWVTAILCLLRKRTEEELGKTQARLAGLVGSAMDAIVTINANQHIILFNAAAEKMFRCSADEAIGQPIDRFIPERFRNAHREHIRAFGETNVTKRSMGALGAIYGLRADGEEFPIEASISQVVADGQKLYTVILRDVSERRRVEAGLAQLAAIVESSDDAIIAKTLDGTIVSWNSGAERMYGYSADEVKGRSISILIPPDHTDEVRQIYERLRRGEEVDHFETVRVKKDGKQIDVSIVFSPIKDAAGKITGASAIARDITERKRAEAALRESEAHFRAIAESAPNAFVGTDSRGRIISWNKGAQRMFQYTEEEVLGQPLTLIMPERYRKAYQGGMERYQHTGIRRFIGKVVELHGRKKDGSEFPVEVSLSSWETDRGEVYHGIIHNITERKQAEEKLKSSLGEVRALAAHLQSVREEEGIRIARAIHDELSPALTALMMDLSQLASGLTTHQKPLVGKIEIMSKLVETTIQSMRKIAGELRPGVLDDLGLIAAIEWQAQEFQTRTGIRCKAILPVEDIALDPARSTAIFRVSQEILTNVARHSGASRVNISFREEAGNAILEAHDNGRGISESEISNPKSLGLLGMRERALLFGGGLKISGIPGKGTTVTVRIPLKQI